MRPEALVSTRWRPASAVVVAGAFVTSRIFLLFFHLHSGLNLKLYRGWMLQAAAGRVPFVDFPIEYPPLAWWLMQLPATTNRVPYYFRFRLIMGAADLGAFILLWWIVSKRRPGATVLVTAVYVATTVLLEYVLYDSLDMMMLFLLLGTLGAWLHAPASSRPGVWRAVAYTALALGASYKVIPIVLLPLLAAGDWQAELRWRPVALRVGLFVLVIVAPFALSYRDAGLATLGFLQYHGVRGLEIGSTWSTLMWLVSPADRALRVVSAFGSWELAGSLGTVFRVIASVSMLLVLLGIAWWPLELADRFDPPRAYLHAMVGLTGLVAASKVFSVQYLLWALPLMMLAAVELVRGRRALIAVAGACVLIAALTTAFYPLGMRDVEPLHTWIMVTLAIRNLLFSTVVVWLLRLALAHDRLHRSARGEGYPFAA